ncbi:hypothetical protein LINPERHAP1_LOCUS23603 [Linum perenne]
MDSSSLNFHAIALLLLLSVEATREELARRIRIRRGLQYYAPGMSPKHYAATMRRRHRENYIRHEETRRLAEEGERLRAHMSCPACGRNGRGLCCAPPGLLAVIEEEEQQLEAAASE